MNRAELQHVATEFRWLHQVIGVVGGVTFFVGSILFLYDGLLQRGGVWLFIVGSAGMLVGNVGNALITYERHELQDPGRITAENSTR